MAPITAISCSCSARVIRPLTTRRSYTRHLNASSRSAQRSLSVFVAIQGSTVLPIQRTQQRDDLIEAQLAEVGQGAQPVRPGRPQLGEGEDAVILQRLEHA